MNRRTDGHTEGDTDGHTDGHFDLESIGPEGRCFENKPDPKNCTENSAKCNKNQVNKKTVYVQRQKFTQALKILN